MKKVLTIYEQKDKYGDLRGQEVCDKENETTLFRCYNMDECPEDAIIGRDLFSAYNFIRAVELGIELAKAGFDGIEYVTEESEN